MAPRRRTTRKSEQKTATRLKKEENMKFHNFLKDFDDQVLVHSQKMDMDIDLCMEQCNLIYNELLISVSKGLLKMKVVDLERKLCGNEDTDKQGADEVSQYSTDIEQLEDAAGLETRMTKMTPSSKAATNGKLPAERVTKASKKQNMLKPGTTSISSEREEVLQTKKRACKKMMDYSCTTPLLQQINVPWPAETPGLRKARRGEKLFTFSINGSPVVTAQHFSTVNLLKKPE
uniref:Borealin C-terminal domain-containing protein n=1 Tax=Eptatretus burgeri TaxID=7764 RepID=A0A8C4Q6D3_EPTBU